MWFKKGAVILLCALLALFCGCRASGPEATLRALRSSGSGNFRVVSAPLDKLLLTDGRFLLLVSKESGQYKATAGVELPGDPGDIRLYPSPNGEETAAAIENKVYIFSSISGRLQKAYDGHKILGLSWAENAELFVTDVQPGEQSAHVLRINRDESGFSQTKVYSIEPPKGDFIYADANIFIYFEDFEIKRFDTQSATFGYSVYLDEFKLTYSDNEKAILSDGAGTWLYYNIRNGDVTALEFLNGLIFNSGNYLSVSDEEVSFYSSSYEESAKDVLGVEDTEEYYTPFIKTSSLANETLYWAEKERVIAIKPGSAPLSGKVSEYYPLLDKKTILFDLSKLQ